MVNFKTILALLISSSATLTFAQSVDTVRIYPKLIEQYNEERLLTKDYYYNPANMSDYSSNSISEFSINYKNDDKVKLKDGTKKVSRLFIDKKVPLLERKMVPVIVNKNNEVIFVYKIYRKYGYKYVKNNLFMIK